MILKVQQCVPGLTEALLNELNVKVLLKVIKKFLTFIHKCIQSPG